MTPPVGQKVPCCVCAICNMEMRSATVGRRKGGLGIDFKVVMIVVEVVCSYRFDCGWFDIVRGSFYGTAVDQHHCFGWPNYK
jgi:hypothetical protein